MGLARPLATIAAGLVVGAAVAAVVAVAACSLEGLDDGPSPDGMEAGADAGSPEGSSGSAGPGCPGCAVLVEGADNPTELGILDGALHWIQYAAAGAVVRSELDGGGLTFDRDHPIPYGHDLAGAFEGNTFESVYAIGGDETMRRYVSFSTCEATTGMLRMTSLGDDLLFARAGDLARGGCGGVTSLLAGTFTGIAGDAPYVWFARESGDIGRCDATSASRCASTSAVLVSGQGAVRTLTRDEARIFWVKVAPPVEIRSRLKTDPTPTSPVGVVATDLGDPKTLAPAGSDLYWTDAARGTIGRAPAAGGGPVVTVASGLVRPWGLLVTGSALYFTESGAGRVVRMPR